MAKKNKKYHFIYKTTNVLSGKYYYGMHSTDNLDDGYLGSGERLWYSIRKHGRENHNREIIEFVDSLEKLKKREREIVNLNEVAKEECMNLKVGGSGGFYSIEACSLGGQTTKEIMKQKYQDIEYMKEWSDRSSNTMKNSWKTGKLKIRSGKENSFYGKNHTEESKRLMSKSRKGKYIGENNSQFGTKWIINGKVNKKINKNEKLPKGFVFGRKI